MCTLIRQVFPLEIFKYIDDVIDIYESKREIYKLISEEIQSFFEKSVFTESEYSLNMTYRLKTPASIREKLLRNSYISKYRDVNTVFQNFQDLIGLRIECKFIDDEKYVFSLLKRIFDTTDDEIYYYSGIFSKLKLKLSDHQPQKQKNGFDIYKIDGLYSLGQESIRFELQIMAMVNSFWGEIEHRIIYKNNTYMIADGFVSEIMTSIKKSLAMIDGQLYTLYNQFKRAGEEEANISSGNAIERFISKMVYDTFSGLMREQVGFSMDFKASCDSVVKYILIKNNAHDMEDYSRVMLNLFYVLNGVRERGVRVDTQFEFERNIAFSDRYSQIILKTVLETVNVNYKWHIFFLVLFNLQWEDNIGDLESFITYTREEVLKNLSFALLDDRQDKSMITEDILEAIAELIAARQNIDCFSRDGIVSIYRAINERMPKIVSDLADGFSWDDIKHAHLAVLKEKIVW